MLESPISGRKIKLPSEVVEFNLLKTINEPPSEDEQQIEEA